MSTRSIEMVDCLSLLSTKVASNVFDLSSGMHHVSIRDQMVRAQIVVRDLCRGDSDFESLLIVGAGVAGICAALEAIQQGVKQVVVVDVREAPFSLLRDVHHRYVGPFMYEWPSTFSNNQSYPVHQTTPWSNADAQLQWIAKDPVSADALANLLTQELKYKLTQINHGAFTICVNVSKSRIHRIVQLFAKTESARSLSRLQRQPPIRAKTFHLMDALIWPSEGAGQKSMINITPNYVLLAAGMGVENRRLVMNDPNRDPYRGENYTGSSFWAKNLQEDLFDPKTANQHVAIFGGGDGALQDTLRALTGCKHPLQFMSFLEKNLSMRRALKRIKNQLLDADRQSRQFSTWTVKQNEYLALDNTCKTIALDLARNNRVVRRVGQGLRQGEGEVSLFVRGGHFDKTYLLNRFLVHLIEACSSAQNGMWSGRMRLLVHRNHWAVGYTAISTQLHAVEIATVESKNATSIYHCNAISVRYGIEVGSIPAAQMIQVSDRLSRQRTSLSRVELPFVAESS